MPMDDYDLGHSVEYDSIINAYANDNLSSIIQKFLQENNLNVLEHEYFTEQIYNMVMKLRNGLSILDDRTITNIGSRLFHGNKMYLVQVWRGNKYI